MNALDYKDECFHYICNMKGREPVSVFYRDNARINAERIVIDDMENLWEVSILPVNPSDSRVIITRCWKLDEAKEVMKEVAADLDRWL